MRIAILLLVLCWPLAAQPVEVPGKARLPDEAKLAKADVDAIVNAWRTDQRDASGNPKFADAQAVYDQLLTDALIRLIVQQCRQDPAPCVQEIKDARTKEDGAQGEIERVVKSLIQP